MVFAEDQQLKTGLPEKQDMLASIGNHPGKKMNSEQSIFAINIASILLARTSRSTLLTRRLGALCVFFYKNVRVR